MSAKDNPPTYQALSRCLRQELADGRYAIGEALPPIRALAATYHCSISTVQKAFLELRGEGLIVSDSTRGTRVSRLPVTDEPRGQIVCIFPKWDRLLEASFAAEFLLGASLAATACGFMMEAVSYASPVELTPLLERLCAKPVAGVVWANPGQADSVARLRGAGVRIVTAIRHFPQVDVPCTYDKLTDTFPLLADLLIERGARQLGILAMGTDDSTYEPVLQALLKVVAERGIHVPAACLCRARAQGLDENARQVLYADLLHQLRPGDGLFSFAPDSLSECADMAETLGRDLAAECMISYFHIRTVPVVPADLLLRGDVRAHGEQAVHLIREWLHTHTPPSARGIPIELVRRPAALIR